ncbi:helix-turn-helix domain-containing protein [Paracidovorax sp. MALMAid1276]|uniref:helix-turn-helix domain-containing protein n=1 Tax=Paracidovorax sp. MALMAid1276 TaxID=3411631 RepID=UPI003B9A21F9
MSNIQGLSASAMAGQEANSGAKTDLPTFGDLLKRWRTTRRYSQHQLADETQVSQRHLSFLESGRSMPSRDMVLHLTQILQVPLRGRNDLLVAAGYAPLYPERALGTADMTAIRQALETTLKHHEPFPALVIDRQWNVVMHNAAVDKLIGLLGNPAKVWKQVDPSGGRNLMRLTLHPKGLQPLIVDWPGTATAILRRLQAEAQANPSNDNLDALIADLRALPGFPPIDQFVAATLPMQLPILPLQLHKKGVKLELFSMICSFGTALDLTAEELRLELLFPSDPITERFLRAS